MNEQELNFLVNKANKDHKDSLKVLADVLGFDNCNNSEKCAGFFLWSLEKVPEFKQLFNQEFWLWYEICKNGGIILNLRKMIKDYQKDFYRPCRRLRDCGIINNQKIVVGDKDIGCVNIDKGIFKIININKDLLIRFDR